MNAVDSGHIKEYSFGCLDDEPNLVVWEYAWACPHIKAHILATYTSWSADILDVMQRYLGQCELRKSAFNTAIIAFNSASSAHRVLSVAAYLESHNRFSISFASATSIMLASRLMHGDGPSVVFTPDKVVINSKGRFELIDETEWRKFAINSINDDSSTRAVRKVVCM
jgi:hypothetical protein